MHIDDIIRHLHNFISAYGKDACIRMISEDTSLDNKKDIIHLINEYDIKKGEKHAIGKKKTNSSSRSN